MNSSDRIERKILLKAPRAKVWTALTDAQAFGNWFGVALQGQRFVTGQRATGQITYPGYEYLVWDVLIEQLLPEEVFAFSWHPYAVDTHLDYSGEPTTLVRFELEDMDGGTLLRVAESGFDGIPAQRRLKAFRMNSRGWDVQMSNIETYLGAA